MTSNNHIVIDIRNVHKSFGDHEVLKGISLRVPKGTTAVILGRSGIGKSVLLKSIIGLLIPELGSIKVKDREVVGMKTRELNNLRRTIGYVFQYAALFDSMTVRENLEFPLRKHTELNDAEIKDRVTEQLELVGLADAVDKMPAELSGGMKKRIGLARAIIIRPEIVLYDEPTAGLDPKTSHEISELILDLEERFGMTSITVTHDLECTRIISDSVGILDDGVIVHEGTFEELQQIDDTLAREFFHQDKI